MTEMGLCWIHRLVKYDAWHEKYLFTSWKWWKKVTLYKMKHQKYVFVTLLSWVCMELKKSNLSMFEFWLVSVAYSISNDFIYLLEEILINIFNKSKKVPDGFRGSMTWR